MRYCSRISWLYVYLFDAYYSPVAHAPICKNSGSSFIKLVNIASWLKSVPMHSSRQHTHTVVCSFCIFALLLLRYLHFTASQLTAQPIISAVMHTEAFFALFWAPQAAIESIGAPFGFGYRVENWKWWWFAIFSSMQWSCGSAGFCRGIFCIGFCSRTCASVEYFQRCLKYTILY